MYLFNLLSEFFEFINKSVKLKLYMFKVLIFFIFIDVFVIFFDF